MVDEDAAHHLRGDGEELCAALPADLVLIVDPQPSFMHERSRLQSVPLSFATQRASRLPAKLLVDDSRELLGCFFVTRSPRSQELGDFVVHSVWRSRNRHRHPEFGKSSDRNTLADGQQDP
jgi:hypothetical protein